GAKSVHEFQLGPLSRSETLTLAERLCPPTLCSGAQLAGIAEESEGFPFLVGEMARALRSGEGDQRADAAPSRMHLVDATRHRIEGLPAATRAVLEVVCVAGGPIDRRLALDVVGLGSRGRPTVTVLEQACLLRSTAEDVAIEVYHDRIREAVLATLDPEERA